MCMKDSLSISGLQEPHLSVHSMKNTAGSDVLETTSTSVPLNDLCKVNYFIVIQWT